jgi:hypothetical protein
MRAVREHYDSRAAASRELRRLLSAGQRREFVRLALGISNPTGNYSSSRHGMGPLILAGSPLAEGGVFELAAAIDACPTTNHLPGLIYDHAIRNLKISVGSEIAMMLKPEQHWVGNVRTIWAHLLVFHEMNEDTANEALSQYYDGDRDSEMNYDDYEAVGKSTHLQHILPISDPSLSSPQRRLSDTKPPSVRSFPGTEKREGGGAFWCRFLGPWKGKGEARTLVS